MSYKIPGLSSFILASFAFGVADIHLFRVSLALGLGYAVGIPIMLLSVFYTYCTKCPHVATKDCRHVIVGWVTQKLFKLRKPTEYTVPEILCVVVAVLALIIFPQYWLISNKALFIAFWALLTISIIIIRRGVCTACGNYNCKFCKHSEKCQ